MKKLCYTAFVAFWSSVATIAALDLLAGEPSAADAGSAYTLEEVARHNTLEDCWMAIEGVVYDLTAYVEEHPTPPSLLAPWCGTEATEGMRTKGYGRDHSQAAWNRLEDFRIGSIE